MTARSTDFEFAHTYRGVPFHSALPIDSLILDCVESRAREQGNAPFVTAVSDDAEDVITYGEVENCSARLAQWIRHKLPDDAGAVGFLPANDISSVIAIFGLLRAGRPILFLNPGDPEARLKEQMDVLGVKHVLSSPGLPPTNLQDAIVLPDDVHLVDGPAVGGMRSDAQALFFATSGSTAASKLVAQTLCNAAVNAEGVRRKHGLKAGDRVLTCLPIHHVNGLHFTIFGTLVAGAHTILARSFDPFAYWRVLEKFRPRIASVVPSILEALLDTQRRRRLPSDFDYFVSAAAPLAATTARSVAYQLGTRINQGYGLTETTNFSTTLPPDLTDEAYARFMLDAEIPSIGTALYGNEVAVLRADGERASPGEIGEICMRGHNVMMEYAANDAATEDAFRGGWFHSQDLGFEVRDPDVPSTFFVVTGRSKNIAKVRGESVSLDEMERVLRAAPDVQDAACVSFPHRLLGDEIVAAVVLSERVTTEPDLESCLRAVFSPASLPRHIVRLEAIPRTPTGKIRCGVLADLVSPLIGK